MAESLVPLIWKEIDIAQKELDKCPFCGCSTVWIFQESGYKTFKAVCTYCSAQMYRGALPELVEAWNRRDDNG